jgi:hypothetical protein
MSGGAVKEFGFQVRKYCHAPSAKYLRIKASRLGFYRFPVMQPSQ